MTSGRVLYRLLAAGTCVVLGATGCAFRGVNSLPLPGTVGRGSDAVEYHVEIANVSTLESNSPVLLNDVVVGSVGNMRVKDWHAEVDVSVRPDVVIPANAVASVGQTSLLGSMHMSLNTAVGQEPTGRLQPNATLGLDDSSTYPTTERTLSSLSIVVNAGGLGQIGDVVHSFNAALNGRQADFRDLLGRLDTFIGTLNDQRDNLISTIEALGRLAGTVAARRDVVDEALRKLPPALEVLERQRPNLTTALSKLGAFSDIATRLVNDSQADLVKNLQNLEPTIRALADVGPQLPAAVAFATVFPYGQTFIDRAIRGDYVNLYTTLDISIPRLRRELLAGTRRGQQGRPLAPAPGEPFYQRYTYDPLGRPLAPPPPGGPLGPVPGSPPTPGLIAPTPGSIPEVRSAPPQEPVLPVAPSRLQAATPVPPPAAGSAAPIFAGPYGASGATGPSPTDAPPTPGGG